MNANEIKNNLSENDIISFLQDLGGDPYKQGNSIISRTICHNPPYDGSHKLYYDNNTKNWHCFTECACSYDIFSLVQQIKGIDFKEAYKYVIDYFGYKETNEHVDYNDNIDMSFFAKFNKTKEEIKLPKVDKSILNVFNNEYHISWVKDHIMPSSMEKFNIKLDVLGKRIVIPTYSHTGDLVGIRVRNLNAELVEKGLKYLPMKHNNVLYNFPMGNVLYGLYQNRNNIEKIKKLVIFESEKSVLALDSYYKGKGIGVAIGGSSLSDNQLELIKELNIEECCIALDKEWDELGSNLEKYYAQKIEKVFRDKLDPYCSVTVIWDTNGKLDEKDSPTDKGFDTWKYLWDNRLYISETGGVNYGEK